MSESARSVLKHLYKEGRMTEEQYKKIDRNLKERPHGEIITDEDGNTSCSECGQTSVLGNFCYNCGADLREGDHK